MQQVKLGHQDRLAILAQLCYEKGVNPSKGNYAGFVRGIACGKLFLSKQTALQLTKTLTTAYYHDKWKSLIGELNEGLQPTINTPKPQTWQPQTTTQTNSQTEPFTLTPKDQANILYSKAKRDTYNNVGRITEADLKEQCLTTEEAIELWQRHFSKFDIEQRSNCLLIFWDGKEIMRSNRDLNRVIQPIEKISANPEGDIVDDTYDETAPQAKEG